MKQYVKFYSSLRFFDGGNKSGSLSLLLGSVDDHCHFAAFPWTIFSDSFILLSLSFSWNL